MGRKRCCNIKRPIFGGLIFAQVEKISGIMDAGGEEVRNDPARDQTSLWQSWAEEDYRSNKIVLFYKRFIIPTLVRGYPPTVT